MTDVKPAPHPVDLPVPEDPNVKAPLAFLSGEQPPHPLWFERVIEAKPERTFVDVAGSAIEALSWGDRGKPGLLFLHGNGAHADWWSFIAPFFAEDYRCTAMSWSGMGRSGWREVYTFDLFVREALEVAQATGLFDGPLKPVVIAHSFGGGVAAYMAAREGARFAASIILDAGIRPPELRWKGPPSRHAPTRVYPDLTSALARFRLAPSQPCANIHLLDYIARESLRPAPMDAADPHGPQGFTWRFDPFIWNKIKFESPRQQEEEAGAALHPVAHIYGEKSRLMQPAVVDYTRKVLPKGSPVFALPEAEHHVMLDQPLALTSALRGLLTGWAWR